MKTKPLYKARWAMPGRPSLGSVDFTARNDLAAIAKADRIGVEIGLPRMPRTIYCEGRLVHNRGHLPTPS